MSICATCGRPDGSVCQPCLEGNPPEARLTADAVQGGVCARGCTQFRRHLYTCPAEDRTDGAWLAVDLQGMGGEETREVFFDGDTHLLSPRWRNGVWVGQYGGLEVWHPCSGCRPRPATHGSVCEPCHLRLTEWLSGKFNMAWAWDWLAADREPRQNAAGLGEMIGGSKTPPAALNLAIYDLRTEILQWFAKWVGRVVTECNLTGPDWWRARVTEADRRRRAGQEDDADWRAPLPRGPREVEAARKFLSAWQERIEDDPETLLGIWEDTEDLMVRVASVAPWRAKPRKLRGIRCPECDRDALVIYEGDSSVTCQRCKAAFSRERYDIWSRILESDREAS